VEFGARFDTLFGSFEVQFKGENPALAALQDRMLSVRDMISTLTGFQQMNQDAMSQAYRSILA